MWKETNMSMTDEQIVILVRDNYSKVNKKYLDEQIRKAKEYVISMISELVKELRNEAQEVRLCSNECEFAELLDRAANTIEMLSEKAREPKQGWIPCSERLPDEEFETYLICTETCYMCSCRWTNDMYGLGATEWSKWGWHIMDKPQYSVVTAWMPLQPWKRSR